ncbi:hypothetical protein QLH51_12885 [Sphingomonas sp. 2R-10]|nr:hypothetical protein [Sphingomonas sp. 2R-10]
MALALLLTGKAAVAQSVDELNADKARLIAQKERDEAARQAVDAAAALKAAEAAAADDLAQRKQAAEATKAVLDAEKANVDLQVANDKAAAARLEQKVGSVPDAPAITGGVTPQTGAGKTEAALLSAAASADAARQIARKLENVGGPFIVRAGTARLSLDQWDQFDVGIKLIDAQLVRAQSLFDTAEQSKPTPAALGTASVRETPFLAAAGVGIQALAKFGKFFQTEYTAGSIDLTPDDSLLVADVGNALKSKGLLLPDMYLAARPGTTILPTLQATAATVQTAVENATAADRSAAALKDEAQKAADAAVKAGKLAAAARYEAAAGAAKAAVTAFEAFTSRMLQADEKGRLPVTAIAEQKVIVDALAAGRKILFVHVHFAGGSYYTYKNLWTFLGKMPFRVSGAIVASYTVLDGKTAAVVDTGSVRVSGGFKTMREVAQSAAPTQ